MNRCRKFHLNKNVIKKIATIFLISIVITVIGCSKADKLSNNSKNTEMVSYEDLSYYFSGYDGCIVLLDENKNNYTIYNESKSQKEISPCSTFKIANSLIGLETKELEDANTAFKWDGTKYPIDSWNKDQTLKSAVANSVVWYFQILALKIGEIRMGDYISKFNYGNKDISGGITKFWLQSSLKISPKEQVEFLRKFYDYQLPIAKGNIDIVKNVILLSDENGIRLSGKTGSGENTNNNNKAKKGSINGWFIGYVEKDNDICYFATNIEANETTKESADGQKAKEITLKILKDKNLC
jgi:bla regulator protein BlaR1